MHLRMFSKLLESYSPRYAYTRIRPPNNSAVSSAFFLNVLRRLLIRR
jgi:hypothetical protein